MPLYDYAPTSGKCSRCHGRFEVFQNLAEKKLTRCPTCDKPCERRISPVKVTGKFSTSNSRVKERGMTKYVKAGDGVYEKAVGTGPDVIRKKLGQWLKMSSGSSALTVTFGTSTTLLMRRST